MLTSCREIKKKETMALALKTPGISHSCNGGQEKLCGVKICHAMCACFNITKDEYERTVLLKLNQSISLENLVLRIVVESSKARSGIPKSSSSGQSSSSLDSQEQGILFSLAGRTR